MDLRNLSIIDDGSILIEDGKIRDVGPTRRIENLAAARSVRQISARGRVVMPGFIDCHMRLISGPHHTGSEPGTIAESRYVRQTPAWRLASDAAATLRRCLRYGTTTLEAKSGGCLDESSELKLLRILMDLAKQQPIHLVSTYCGAADFESLTGQIAKLSLALIHEKRMADFVGVNCGPTGFDEPGSRTVLESAARLSMPVKIHTGNAAPSLGVALAREFKARTIEHLERITPADIARVAESESIAVLTPGHGFHQPQRGFAPARDLIAAGASVALATGYDRALSPSFSMPIAIELACRTLGMAPSEAIVAATLNAAYAVGRGDKAGSIEPGKSADLLILETPDYRDLAYETGVNPVDVTIARGEIVCRNSVSYGTAASASSWCG